MSLPGRPTGDDRRAQRKGSPATTWVLLRGLTRERRHWGDFIARMRAAWPAAEVIALDLPGNGELNTLPSPLNVAAMTEHLRGQLRQRGITAPVHLLAMSLGGMVAIDWAQRHPHDVAAAVLINTSAGGVQPWHRRLKPGAWGPLLRAAWPGATPAQRELAIARITTRTHATATAAPPHWLALQHSQPVSAANAARQLIAALRYAAPREPPAAPLLLLASAGDRLVDPRCSRSLANAWEAAHAEHPNAGHDLALDDPAWLLRAIGNWLEAP